ncbi:SGNH/GDSL hydrolase family protein [Solitalea sp. MAHUQ-68]|uniref:SGNH/GDSL hydrolase family protein n=1 Tax=Solitalea agri TaxID=2953739 RepID=A0A9X2JBI3_9SPHI|nr:SGNH/GDSL hydrolase family protein [Solitalea agri]MCO4292507.1 SGNH/GDSL hydrolase family protein [Solitalea agri]
MRHSKIILSIAIMLLTISAGFIAPKKKVVFFGDSITQMGVNPGGYICRLDSLLKTKVQGNNHELIGAGIGGNKVYDLYLRMDDDVLAKNPDVVVIWVGVNDVWHKVWGTGTDADKFEVFYKAIIKKLQARNIKVILCTPAVIGEKTDFTNQMDGDLNKYSQIIRDLAKTNNLPVCDLRKVFLEYDKQNNPENKEFGILTTDKVHLTDKGNELVAEEMLKVIAGF